MIVRINDRMNISYIWDKFFIHPIVLASRWGLFYCSFNKLTEVMTDRLILFRK